MFLIVKKVAIIFNATFLWILIYRCTRFTHESKTSIIYQTILSYLYNSIKPNADTNIGSVT